MRAVVEFIGVFFCIESLRITDFDSEFALDVLNNVHWTIGRLFLELFSNMLCNEFYRPVHARCD